MKYLQTGTFFGETNTTIKFAGLTLTDTEYTHPKVDWHYHENAYFTFILQGKLIEGNKKESYNCSAGSLLFHSWQEPHYNIKPEGYTRGFHLEFDENYFENLDFDTSHFQGSFKIENPDIKILLYKILRETKIYDRLTLISIQTILFDIFGKMILVAQSSSDKKPQWVKKIKEILHENYVETLSLEFLAKEANIHPIHLSRAFSKHFHCTLGEYVRKIRIEKSLSLLSDKRLSLAEIAFNCGFADQSHFGRSFKGINGVSPSEYRKLI